MTESRNGLGWKGPDRPPCPSPPAMGRDPFHQPRVLRALSNLALNPAREGAATASLGSLGQGLTSLEECLPYVPESPPFQLEAVTPCPVTPCL